MSSQSAPSPITKSSGQLREWGKRLHEPWLMLVRVLWLAVALLSIGLFIVSIPQHAHHLHVVCLNALCGGSEKAVAQWRKATGRIKYFAPAVTLFVTIGGRVLDTIE
jgi:hypothetical protein